MSVSTRAEAEQRKYGRYNAHPYNPERCVANVYDPTGWGNSHQCCRKPGYGVDALYCKQHDPVEVARRDKERHDKWDREWSAKQTGWQKSADKAEAADLLVEVWRWISANRELVNHDEWLARIAGDISGNAHVARALEKADGLR